MSNLYIPVYPRPAFSHIYATGAAAGFSPARSTTYYFAVPLTVNPGTLDQGGLIVPVNSTLRRVDFLISVLGTLGSNEPVIINIRKNHTTDISVGSISCNTTVNLLANANLSAVLAAGDSLVMKITTPNWVTAPTVCFFQAQAYADLP